MKFIINELIEIIASGKTMRMKFLYVFQRSPNEIRRHTNVKGGTPLIRDDINISSVFHEGKLANERNASLKHIAGKPTIVSKATSTHPAVLPVIASEAKQFISFASWRSSWYLKFRD